MDANDRLPYRHSGAKLRFSSDYIYCVGGYAVGLAGKNAAAVDDAALSPSGIGPRAPTTPYPNPVGGDCVTDSGYIYCVTPRGYYNGTVFTSTSDAFFAPLSANGIGSWSQSVGYLLVQLDVRQVEGLSTASAVVIALHPMHPTMIAPALHTMRVCLPTALAFGI